MTPEQQIAALREENARLKAGSWCDVCCGTGDPKTGNPCICGGTGSAQDAARELRVLLYALEKQRDALAEALKQSKSLQDLTLTNQIRWMKYHDDLLNLVASLKDWRSPDGVLRVHDLKWFKDLPPATSATLASVDEQKQQEPTKECSCSTLPTPAPNGGCSKCGGSLIGRVTTKTLLF